MNSSDNSACSLVTLFICCTLKKLKFRIDGEEKFLEYSLPLKGFRLPAVFSDFGGFAVAACCASFVSYVIGSSAAASTSDVDDFSCSFTL